MIEPTRAAFLLIDMQNGFIDPTSALCVAGAADTVPACAQAIDDFFSGRRPQFVVPELRDLME